MKRRTMKQQIGMSLIELMVALAIGSFLIIGSVQIYDQSRQAYSVNESIARVQEIAQFAMDTIEADLRMASNWGQNSSSLAVEGRSITGDANPGGLNVPTECGDDWALNLALPVDGTDDYNLACAPPAGSNAQANSDVITVRRASVTPVATSQVGRLQIQSTRIQGQLFIPDTAGDIPAGFSPVDSATHTLFVSSYYVAAESELVPGVPTLRRHRLVTTAGAPAINDEEVAPGVENIQLQLGIDIDQDNTVDRYVDPGAEVYNPAAAGYVPGARVLTARVWMIVRGLDFEAGIQDVRDYEPGNEDLGVQTDGFRRMQVSKTILLRNARS